MNSPIKAMPESLDSQANATAALSATRPLYWSVRREFWEYRSLYIAPLAVAALTLFGYLIATMGYAISKPNLAQRRAALEEPLSFAAGVIMGTAFIVSIFYSLDALHGERRDRSILFWKSLPVSDFTTVLSKASIPLIVLPLLAFAIVVATQLIMLILSTLVLLGSGLSIATLWIPVFQMSLMLLYHLVTVHMLWYAPLYGWLLLISAWARRAPFLWAALPPLAICAVEKIAFNTMHVAAMLQNRLGGGAEAVTAPGTLPMDPMTHLTPGNFISSPGLWIGLVIAAGFLAAAVRLRRYQGPI
jgi:ABC-2 type transport system permease protein